MLYAAAAAAAVADALLEVRAGLRVYGAALGNELHSLPVDPEGNALRHEPVPTGSKDGVGGGDEEFTGCL